MCLSNGALRRARPPDAPIIEAADLAGAAFTNNLRKMRIAKTTPSLQRVREMVFPVIGLFLAKRRRDGHLRHDRRTAASDETTVG
jgi:hypothetical protein